MAEADVLDREAKSGLMADAWVEKLEKVARVREQSIADRNEAIRECHSRGVPVARIARAARTSPSVIYDVMRRYQPEVV